MAENRTGPPEEPQRRSEPADNPNQPKPDWVQGIAHRSTGLQRPPAPTSAAEQDAAEARRLWRLAGLGLQFAGTVALFWWLGWKLDGWLGTGATWTITLVCVAIIGSLYLLIKEALRENK